MSYSCLCMLVCCILWKFVYYFPIFCYSDPRPPFDIILCLHVSKSGQKGSDNEIYFFYSLKVDWCEKEFRFEKGDTIYFLCAIKILKQHRYDARKGLFYLTKFDKILNKYWLVWHRWNYDLYLPTCKVRYEITSTVTLNEWKTLS